jgi:phenylacetate-coenzyme A ligase PaaK-like adenylate-forming protein
MNTYNYINNLTDLNEVRNERFLKTLKLCFDHHPFYKDKYKALNLNFSDIKSLNDIDKLPLVTKADYMINPEKFRLNLSENNDASFEEKTLWNVAYTTGTTSGKPSPFFNNTHDQFNIMLQAIHAGNAEGLNQSDLIANLLPLSSMPTGGFLVVGRTGDALGIPVISALTGAKSLEYPIHRTLDEAIDCLAICQPTVLWGIPSFLRHLLKRTLERNISFHRVRMILATGEPVSDTLQKEFIEYLKKFGANEPQLRIRYSFTEMQGGLVQCCNNALVQNLSPDLYYLEVVDPVSGKKLDEGEEGALALTHLHRRGTVFVRYLVGDIVTLKLDNCPHCGRLGEIVVKKPRRTGGLLKVKGLLINPDLIIDVLSGNQLINEFQIIIRKEVSTDPDSLDELVIKLDALEKNHHELNDFLSNEIKRVVMIRPNIEFASLGEIYDPMKNMKIKRVIDLRP